MSWKILEKENIKFDIIDKERKKILLYNKKGNTQRIILKDSGYIGNLNKNLYHTKKKQYELFEKNNIKYPRTEYVGLSKIDNITLNYPMVGKPINSGKDVKSFPIPDKESLLQKINDYERKIKVQENIKGDNYRILVYKNNVISICKKNDAILIGDGVSNLETLLENYNNYNKKYGFSTIKKSQLKQYNFEKIREKEELINLSKHNSINGKRWTTYDITFVHNDNIELFIRSLKALDYVYGGIDFIIPDISKSYKEQNYGIIEIISDPSMELMDTANKISDYNSCNNEYGKLFFDIIKIWYNE